MKTLKQAWFKLMKQILKKQKTNTVEDYIELQCANLTFSCLNIYELTTDENIQEDFEEMKKVFFSNEKNIFGHSYGSSLLTPFNEITNPVDAMVTILKDNPNTRKAVLTFIPYGDKKVPCITSIQFLVRNNKLNIFYTSRSQDIFRKFPLDAMCIVSIAEEVAKQLNIELGFVNANIISAHIYLKDIEKAKKLK